VFTFCDGRTGPRLVLLKPTLHSGEIELKQGSSTVLLTIDLQHWSPSMNTIAAILSRATGTHIDNDRLKPVLIFSAISLGVILAAVLSYGIDLSRGFF
jgi:hypothetical protein